MWVNSGVFAKLVEQSTELLGAKETSSAQCGDQGLSLLGLPCVWCLADSTYQLAVTVGPL